MAQEQAEEAIRSAGFEVGNVSTAKSDSVQEGHVISQDPGAGSHREEGTRVNLVISGGEDTFALPDVVDEKEETARRTLEQMGLTVTSRTEYSSDVEEGHVISTNPAAGQQVSKAVTVELVVSRGAETVDVPDVSGMTESQARSALQGAGFQVSSSTEQSSSVQEGHVIRYNPTGKADKGSTVTIVVSSGTPEKQIPYVTGLRLSPLSSSWRAPGSAIR